MKYIISLPGLLLALCMCSCGVSRPMEITSEPSGALVLVDDVEKGTTPLTVTPRWAKSARSPQHRKAIVVRKDGFESWRREYGYSTAVEQRNPWKLHANLERLEHRFTLRVETDPEGALVRVGDHAPQETPFNIPFDFSRGTSVQYWPDLHVRAHLLDHQTTERRYRYEEIKRNPHIKLRLPRIRHEIPLNITANVSDATVLVDDHVIGSAPLEHTFVFERESETDAWNTFEVTVHRDGYTARQHAAPLHPREAGPKPYSRTLTRDDALLADGALEKAELAPIQYLPVRVRRYVIGSEGLEQEAFVTLSQVTDVEKEPRAHSVARMTSAEGFFETRVSVMPDSETIVYSRTDELPYAPGTTVSNLWAQRGTELARHTDGQLLDLDPAVSADGRWIYFSSDRLRPGQPDIWRIQASGKGGLTKITDSQSSLADIEPSLSPDGSRLAYTTFLRGRVSAGPEIWIVRADGTLPTQLRRGRHPAWSPDGTRIAYIAPDVAGYDQIWVMRADGSNPTQLTTGDFHHSHPCWTPDGNHIVYSCNQAVNGLGFHKYDIWIMSADGSGKTQLTTNGSDDTRPVVSQNGRYIYFNSTRGAQQELEESNQIWRLELHEEYLPES